MKILEKIFIGIIFSLVWSSSLNAEIFFVSSQQEFDEAHFNANLNDSIIWAAGTFSDIFMEIEKDHLFIAASTLGGTIFTGNSRVDITGDYIILQGFQFLNGNIGTKDVINTRGSYNKFTQINIRAYTSYKYLRVREESQYAEITFCNFENRLNLDDQNILSILVDPVNPGYHKIQYCSFKNFEGIGNDMGIEPIRIGLSTQADHISRTLVEYCYFSKCDGDGELISSKASQNVYRYNTFENNPKAELVLRHGSEAIVYGNFFLNGKGGVRVREGQNHYIYNNYFYELDDRTIYLQNEDSDPLENINIAFNTIVSCSEVILGGIGIDKPTNVTFANNIFAEPDNDLFEEATGTETWIGNIFFGNLGITTPSSGLTNQNPMLIQNSEGFFELSTSSPAIDAAQVGYDLLPQFPGMYTVDTEITSDIMKENRPEIISEKDLGCSEFPHISLVQPIATEENTGPYYNTSTITSVQNTIPVTASLKLSPNPVSSQLRVTMNIEEKGNLLMEIFNIKGQKVADFSKKNIRPGKVTFSKNLCQLVNGFYTIQTTQRNSQGKIISIQTAKFIKNK